MWIVNLALRRPYTFVVVALLILLIGALAALRMPVDIFPSIDIPRAMLPRSEEPEFGVCRRNSSPQPCGGKVPVTANG